jgi:hypothetical protein
VVRDFIGKFLITFIRHNRKRVKKLVHQIKMVLNQINRQGSGFTPLKKGGARF